MNSPDSGRADLLIKNGLVIDPFRETIERRDLSVKDGRVLSHEALPARETFDASGLYVAPGFIDSHLHLEGLHLLPAIYATAFLSHGTTTIVTDLHEIANAGGLEGMRWYMSLLDTIPLDVFIMAPSCVPSSRFERGKGRIGPGELRRLRKLPRVIGLGEVMDIQAVLTRKRRVMEKIEIFSGRPIDGHAPGMRGEPLSRYLAAGIHSDHETTALAEAEEKIGKGMHLFLRNGSVAKDLPHLLPAIRPENLPFLSLCTDDLSAHDLYQRGHMDEILRLLVRSGISLFRALRLATVNPAAYFNLADRRYPGIGKRADFVIFEGLQEIRLKATIKDGKVAWRQGEDIYSGAPIEEGRGRRGLSLATLTVDDLRHRAGGERVHVMGVREGSIVTEHLVETATREDGYLTANPARDIHLAYVFDRYRAEKGYGFGFVRGFGLKNGAIASTYAHDAHNLVVVGDTVENVFAAREAVGKQGGGMAVIRGGKVVESIPMPFYGIISNLPADELVKREERMQAALAQMGATVSNAFFQMSFLSLPVIPELRLAVRGLFDVTRTRYINASEG